MKISRSKRIADSSVLIGFPLGAEHDYSPLYEGKQLFYCEVSDEEVRNYFSRLAEEGVIGKNEVDTRTLARLENAAALKVTGTTEAIADHLLSCYETVWELEDRWGLDGRDLLIASCAIEHKLPLIGHDHIFQRIEIIFPEVFHLYTLLDNLNTKAVERAMSRLHLIENTPSPWSSS